MSPGAVNLHLLLSPPAVREPSREGASAGATLLGVHFHSDAGEGEGRGGGSVGRFPVFCSLRKSGLLEKLVGGLVENDHG